MGRLRAMVFLAGCFLAGLIAGCVFASHLGQDADTGLSDYLDGYFALAEQGDEGGSSLLATAWEVGRWPLAAGVLGMTAFGALAVPAVFCVRGFLLSYTVSVFLLIFGPEGLPLALAVFGLSAVLSVTALFFIGPEAFCWGRRLSAGAARDGRGERPPDRRSLLLRAGWVTCWLSVGILLQHWLAPVLVRAAAGLVMS